MTPEFNPQCECFYLDFYYHAYGDAVKNLAVYQEGYDQPLWSVNVTSINRWLHMRQTYYTTHPTRVLFYSTSRSELDDRVFPIYLCYHQLLFVGVVGNSPRSDYALDDISIENCDICGTVPTTMRKLMTNATSVFGLLCY